MTVNAAGLEWGAMSAEAFNLFRDLLRVDTTNPPGREGACAAVLARSLAQDGLECQVLVPQEGRANLVVRLPATHPSGAGPLLLTGHLDVVPADATHWKHPPFEAVEEGGYVFGRGAVDMKNMVAMSAMVMKIFWRAKLPRDRDIIFAAVSDEEEGCRWGSQWMVERHPEVVRAEFMVGEIGGFPMDVMGTRFYPVQVAEKGLCWFKLTATADPGHGSMPSAQAATHQLIKALASLTKRRLPQHNTAVVSHMIRTLASHQRWPVRTALETLLKPALSGLLLPKLKPAHLARNFAAMLSNTVAVTRLEAGDKINTLPATATAYIDGRTLPGQTEESFLDEVRSRIGKAASIEVIRVLQPVETAADGPLYESITRALGQHDPKGVPLPYMIPGFTDAKFFSQLGTRCFGFSPIRWPAEDKVVFSELFHGHNERAHVEGFKWGCRVLFDAVSGLVTPK